MSNEKSALGVYKYDESLTTARLKIVSRNKEKRGKKRAVCLSQADKTNNSNQSEQKCSGDVAFQCKPLKERSTLRV